MNFCEKKEKSRSITWQSPIKVVITKKLRFNGLACRTNRGYPSEAEINLKVLLFETVACQTNWGFYSKQVPFRLQS